MTPGPRSGPPGPRPPPVLPADCATFDADAYFGKVLRASPSGTRLGRSQALTTHFLFLELRHNPKRRHGRSLPPE